MVFKKLILSIFILAFVNQNCFALFESNERTFKIVLKKTNKVECEKTYRLFLEELQSIIIDESIEIASDQTSETMTAECLGDQVICTKGDKKVELQYLEKAGGFEPAHWLSFQRAFLNDSLELSDLKPQSSLDKEDSFTSVSPPETTNKSIFKKWWFWTAIGAGLATAATAGYLIQKSGKNSMVRVEIK